MNNSCNKFNDSLLNAIKKYIPDNINPAGFLMELLHIERSAAYRRLRGEIRFTFEEASLIAKKLEFSLDLIIDADNILKVSPFRMCTVEYETPDEIDYEILDEYMDLIKLAQQDPLSILTVSANMVPQQIYIQYESLLKFFFLKWIYYNEDKQTRPYDSVKIPERMLQILHKSFDAHLEFKKTCYILDNDIFQYLINDIRYFLSIGLLEEKDKESIRSEIYDMINYLEEMCITGKNKKGNDVQIYISNLSLEKTSFTIRILNYYIAIIEVCVFNGVATKSKKSFEKISGWVQARCRTSTDITCCGELQRIDFFNKQRKFLETL